MPNRSKILGSAGGVLMFVWIPAVQAAQVKLPVPRLGLRFEQSSAQGEFIAHGPGYRVQLTAKSLGLSLDGRAGHAPEVLTMEFTHANPRTELVAEQLLPGFTNYFSGQDPQRWRTEVPAYGRVRYRNLYPGIDLVFYGAPDSLEYDFIVHPESNPAAIELTVNGAQNARVDATGELVLATRAGAVRWKRPAIYQLSSQGERTAVPGRFAILRPSGVRFELGEYDRQRDLIIDPVLSYATYLGGSSNDAAHAIAIDGQGNVFLAGGTTSQNLQVRGALQPGYNGGSVSLLSGDAFVAKFDPNGALLYLTYLGGQGDDYAFGLAVDAAGNAWVAGTELQDRSMVVIGGPHGTDQGHFMHLRADMGKPVACRDAVFAALLEPGLHGVQRHSGLVLPRDESLQISFTKGLLRTSRSGVSERCLPANLLRSGFGSKDSTWLTPPNMNSQITRLALGAKCGLPSGADQASESAERALRGSIAPSASPVKPIEVSARNTLRECPSEQSRVFIRVPLYRIVTKSLWLKVHAPNSLWPFAPDRARASPAPPNHW